MGPRCAKPAPPHARCWFRPAAQKWGVDKSQCRAESGFVINTTNNAKLSYGKLAGAAAKLPVPANVALKDPKQFRLIGKSIKRLDTADKVTGQDAVRNRCAAARHGLCGCRALPGLRRQGSQFRCHESEGFPGREAGGADFARRRRGCR